MQALRQPAADERFFCRGQADSGCFVNKTLKLPEFPIRDVVDVQARQNFARLVGC